MSEWAGRDMWAGDPVVGGAASIPFDPLLGITLGGMDLNGDGYVTSVTDNGGGDVTYGLDFDAVPRTFVGNGDLFRFDRITDWAAAGSQTHALEVRIDIVARPTDDGGNPYIALYHRSGAGPIRTGIGAVGALVFAAAGDSGRMVSSLSTNLSTATAMGNPTAFVMRLIPAIGALVPQYGIDFRAEGTSETTTRWNTFMSSVALPTTVQVDGGYDVGSHLGLSLGQLAAGGTGTGSVRLRYSSRIVPLPTPS